MGIYPESVPTTTANLSVVTPDGTVATAASQSVDTDASGNARVNVTLAANASIDATKPGTVTIEGVNAAGEDFTTVVTIIQEKAYTISTTLSSGASTAVYAAAAAGSYTINMTGLTASKAYTVTSSNATMATVDPSGTANGSGNAAVAVTLTENTSGSTRTSTITITDNTTGTASTVVINQIP